MTIFVDAKSIIESQSFVEFCSKFKTLDHKNCPLYHLFLVTPHAKHQILYAKTVTDKVPAIYKHSLVKNRDLEILETNQDPKKDARTLPLICVNFVKSSTVIILDASAAITGFELAI